MFPSPAQRTFHDAVTFRMAGAISFAGFLAWGLYDYHQTNIFEPLLWTLIGIVGVLCAYAFIWAAARKVTFHMEGISYRSLVRHVDIPWTDIWETRYKQTPEQVEVGIGWFGLVKNLTFRNLQIIGQSKITLNSNISQVEEAMQLVFQNVNPRIKELAESMLSSRGIIAFGNIALSPEGVIWKENDPVPYSAIVKCCIDGLNIKIKSEGKWLNDISVNTEKVPNVFVLLDMIEERRLVPASMQSAAVTASSAARYL
jgi:uncharacterized protein DUF6585